MKYSLCFRAQSEALSAMRETKDPGTMDFCRADISNFSYESCYDELLRTHPLLINVLIASMSKEDISCIQVVYPTLSVIISITIIIIIVFFIPFTPRILQGMVLGDLGWKKKSASKLLLFSWPLPPCITGGAKIV